MTKSEFTRLTGQESDAEGERFGKKFFRLLRPCLAEFVGVCLFVFVGCLSVETKQPSAIALAHGLAIAVLVMCFGHISGGHLNPAVTLGVALSGGIGPIKAVFYVISQLLGSVVGAILVRIVLSGTSIAGGISAYTLINGGIHSLNAGIPVIAAIVCELVITLVLVKVVLLTAVDDEGRSTLAPIGIGLSVTIGILAAFNTTGGSMNPARSFGPAVVMLKSSAWAAHYVYWVGPALGAGVAALLYKFVFAVDARRIGSGK